jgi:hypothetical protein
MQCKLIVEDATMKQARNMNEEDESIPEIIITYLERSMI